MKKLFFIFKIALSAIIKNTVRSFLSILGISIGIAAVIAMLGLGNGAQNSIAENVGKLGANTITITSNTQNGLGGGLPSTKGPSTSQNSVLSVPISKADYLYLRDNITPEVDNIKQVAATATETDQVEIASKSVINTQVQTITNKYFEVQGLNIKYGKASLESDSNSLIAGSQVAENIVKSKNLDSVESILNTEIKVKSKTYKIVGVLDKTDSLVQAAANSSLFIDAESYIKSNETSTYFSSVNFSVKDSKNLADTKTQIENKFRAYRGIQEGEDSNFGITTTAELASTATQITSILTLLLAGISGISLLVGGIGISNIMLVSVTERTKEIGLRKAIGAKRIYILSQFLIEAVLLTVIGGILGVIMGYLLAIGVGSAIGLSVSIMPENIALATGVSSLVGILFGFLPALNASRLSPVEALRYE